MPQFRPWLLVIVGRQDAVLAGVLAGYEHAVREELRKVVARTAHPAMRQEFVAMLDCPTRDRPPGSGPGECSLTCTLSLKTVRSVHIVEQISA